MLLAGKRVRPTEYFPVLAQDKPALQTAEEQIAMAKTLAGVFGGRFVKVDENGEEIADEQ